MPKRTVIIVALFGALAIMSTLSMMAGCESSAVNQPQAEGQAAQEPVDLVNNRDLKGGAQLWAENCMRCHNIRSPRSYTDAQWEVAAHHMRVRGNLLADEHRSILAFLKSGN